MWKPESLGIKILSLQQILVNLMGNAIKFTSDRGRIALDVDYRVRGSDKGHLHVSVKDSGIGIESDVLEDIFNAFTQADPGITRRYGGTGLGLSISAQLVNLMGGEISVDSKLGEGSCFKFFVSLDISQENTSSPITQSSFSADIVFPKSLSVLVVEDNLLNQKLAVRMLEKEGFRIEVVSHGKAAVRKMFDDPDYDLILMDLHMPVMGGEEAAALIRSMPSGGDIPIIALTANAMIGERERCLGLGFNGYVTKPIDKNVLLAEISSCMKTKSLVRKFLFSSCKHVANKVLVLIYPDDA